MDPGDQGFGGGDDTEITESKRDENSKAAWEPREGFIFFPEVGGWQKSNLKVNTKDRFP